jgi:hypothetical protein
VTTLPRAATSPELVKLRSDNQSTQLYLTIHQPATVYTARLAAVPSSTDKVAEITYNTGSGTLANVLQDMTLLIGSSAGAHDYGIARIRKDGTTTAGTFYIGEISDVLWVSNCYLTCIDSFDLWPRHINIASDGTTPLMDYDVAYTNQNETAGAVPTPIMGPPAVLWLRGASVAYSPDASSSWVKDGTISAYSWACTGATVTNGTTATPTITFDTLGTYRLDLTVTGSNSVTFTGHRVICVVDESHGVTTNFTLDNCAGNMSAGGWQFGVTLYDEATLSLVRDRALCILHSLDWYGNTAGSIGYVAGCENIVALGWIAGETITRGTDDQFGTVRFDVQGPQYWLGQMTAFPSGVKDVSDATTPNKWTKFRGLTLNKAWYHFMRWRTTATRCMDVYPNTDGRRHKRLEAPGGENIWAQLVEICQRSMLVNPCCDRYGRIFCEIEQQLVSNRSAMPVVQALTTADWHGDLNIERTPTDEASLIDLSGIAWDGTTATPYFALAPGHVFKHYGAVEVVDRLMLTAVQADTNTLAGLYSAWKNNEYKRIDIKLAANHRLFDIAPYQRMTLAIAASDTPRGITESLTMIPRSISYNLSDGALLTDATFEAEVVADIAITGDTPPDPPQPPITPIEPPVIIPPVDPPPVDADAREIWFSTADAIYYSGDFDFSGVSQPTYTVAGLPAGFNSVVRFCMTLSGAYAYMIAVVSGKRGLWCCANPKDVSPTWVKLIEDGDGFKSGTFYGPAIISLAPHGELVVSQAYCDGGALAGYYILEISGATYTATQVIETTYSYNYLRGVCYQGCHKFKTGIDLGWNWRGWFSDTIIGGFDAVDNRSSTPWRNMIPYAVASVHNYYAVQDVFNVGDTYYMMNVGKAPPLFYTTNGTTGTTWGLNGEVYPRGAWYGDEIDFVDGDGNFYQSTDGVTLVLKSAAPWVMGCVEQGKLSGGGPLVWIPKQVLTSGEMMRLSIDSGVNWTNMTGNFWSIATGTQTFINMNLVF